jgi:hypothetical protein
VDLAVCVDAAVEIVRRRVGMIRLQRDVSDAVLLGE